MKNSTIFGIIAIIIVIGLVIVGVLAITGNIKTEDKTIDVQGTATITKPADKVWMSIGVVTESTESEGATKAENENKEISNKIYTTLKNLNLTSADYKTEYYAVNPKYDWEKGQKLIGYTVTHQIRIDSEKIDMAAFILDAAIEAGANNIYGVNFDLSDNTRETAKAEALKQATEIAKSKAESMASGTGVTITGIKRISDSTVDYIPYRYEEMSVSDVSAKGGAENIITESGSVEVLATVFISYKFK